MSSQNKHGPIDISHELKTRLTIMRGEIELALRKTRTRKEYISTLESLLEEVEDFQTVIENFLRGGFPFKTGT